RRADDPRWAAGTRSAADAGWVGRIQPATSGPDQLSAADATARLGRGTVRDLVRSLALRTPHRRRHVLSLSYQWIPCQRRPPNVVRTECELAAALNVGARG